MTHIDKKTLRRNHRDLLESAEREVDAGNLSIALNRIGRNNSPKAVRRWYRAGRIDADQLRTIILNVWGAAEFPCRELPRSTWLAWFELVGFVSDIGASPPISPTKGWRAQVGRGLGMSWTRDRAMAEWFHNRNASHGAARRLLCTLAPPHAVLGIIDNSREREIILHPHRIEVEIA